MTNQSTLNKLIEMRMTAMADALRHQFQTNDLHNLSFEERIGYLVDLEYTARKNNRLKRLIRNASFDQTYASIADINYTAGRKINKAEIDQLAHCDYIREHYNIIMLGATGSGKSYLACALGMEACKQFYKVKYIRLPELLAELSIAWGEGQIDKALSQYGEKTNLLILDEWLLVQLSELEAKFLLEIVHKRHKKASTIFCSQFSPRGWHSKIGDGPLADAILDRIVHNSYTISLQQSESDRSMREIYGLTSKLKTQL